MQAKHFFYYTQFIMPYVLQLSFPAKALQGNQVRPVVMGTLPSVVCLSKIAPASSLDQNLFCSGVLLTHTHVLTAETCFTGVNNLAFQIIVGTDGAENGVCTYPLWWTSFELWATHFHVPIQTQHNNIAVVKLMGFVPEVRLAPLSQLTPMSVLEGFNVDLYGCKVTEGLAPNIISEVKSTVSTRATCQYRVSQLAGQELTVPVNYICTSSTPYAHLEQNDLGGPVSFFGSIVAVNVGLYPTMNGQFNSNKVNAHVGIDYYRNFLQNIINY